METPTLGKPNRSELKKPADSGGHWLASNLGQPQNVRCQKVREAYRKNTNAIASDERHTRS